MTLFVLMVLLPAGVFGVLTVRALRGEQARLDNEKGNRQRQVVQFAEADLTHWLFSMPAAGPDSKALLRFEVQDDLIVFPEFGLSLPATGSPQQRPFDSAPPTLPLTRQLVIDQYFPRILAFRRDLTSGRNAGAQYFRQLRALIVQPPARRDGYVVALQDVVAHVDVKLAGFSTDDSLRARTWIAAERSALPPAGSVALDGFPFFAVVFDAAEGAGIDQRNAYSLGLLVAISVLGSIFVYRAVSHETRMARLRNDFVAAVSHEFRSPLSSILALTERLERVSDPEKLREYHRIIGQDARRLSALVTRLLDFALIEEGKEVYSVERVDLVAAAREAIEGCQHVAGPDRIRLLGAGAAPLWVRGDRTALRHAIQNVIENAAKYSPLGAPILVQCGSANGTNLVEVQDRGIGVPASEQGRIFEKFYRGRHVAGSNVQGVGIGLALVQHVMASHGGSVDVESRPGEGSRFSLRLPKAEV